MQQRIDTFTGVPLFQATPSGLLAEEDAISPMLGWMRGGQRAALVTLVGIEGGAPRYVGAQMAVASDGSYAGYLSGGCLEQSVVLEALEAIAQGENRLVRYGRGSRYLDIRLPCGSGLDLYFDQSLGLDDIERLAASARNRRPMLLKTDLASGSSTVEPAPPGVGLDACRRTGDAFQRAYPPALQLALIGTGPGLVGLASVAATLGLGLRLLPLDSATRAGLAGVGLPACDTDLEAALPDLDAASAAVVVLHDHDREPDLLAKLLASDCFYIGVLGNHAVHRTRLAALAARGLDAALCARIHAPVGAIPGAKSAATLAVGVLMEVMAEAKQRGLVP